MSKLALSDSFEYLCYEYSIINSFTLSSAGIDFSLQTSDSDD